MDSVPVKEVQKWEREFITFIHEQKSEVYQRLADSAGLDDEISDLIDAAIQEFQEQYKAGKNKTANANA